MSIEKVLYTAQATATGGRDGRAVSSDGALDVALTRPRELGGNGAAGTNPEQLFAAGYSACFLSALQFVAGKEKIVLPASSKIQGKVESARSRPALRSRRSCASRCRICRATKCRRWSRRRTSFARTRTRLAATSM